MSSTPIDMCPLNVYPANIYPELDLSALEDRSEDDICQDISAQPRSTNQGQAISPHASPHAPLSFLALIKSYFALTKPRVIELLIISTIPAMLMADRGGLHLMTMFITLIGGWLGAGCANALNMIVDADIDQQMHRTRNRPLVNHAMSKGQAYCFAGFLGLSSVLLLGFLVNPLSAILVILTIAFYIFVYTLVLKRRTWQNVIWGGAAGCMPALVGWSAITGGLAWQPCVLFGIVFLWTPTHTWALAMHYHDDYAKASVPMFPVLESWQKVSVHMLAYTCATVAVSFVLIPAAGWIYAVGAIGAGIWFIAATARFSYRIFHLQPLKPMGIFLLSNLYLAILCMALSLDSLLNTPLLSITG